MEEKTKSSSRKYWLLGGVAGLALLGVLVVATGLIILRNRPAPGGRTQDIPLDGGGTTTQGGTGSMQTGEERLTISLSEGQPQPQAPQAMHVATGEPLSEEEIEAILSRLPGLVGEPQDQADFRLPGDPIPPPRTGETIQESFPPPPGEAAPETIPASALEVLRFAPEGEISIAPFVSVSFNQPMVPLGTLEELAAMEVPVRIEPALEGTWRWLGTKTLTFEYDSELIDRLPKATAYRVSVPAGTKSATGGVLAETVEWSFSTPPPKMTFAHPNGIPQPLQPLILIAFDQRIDTAAVLETIQVRAGGQDMAVELATQEQIQADEEVSQQVKHISEDAGWHSARKRCSPRIHPSRSRSVRGRPRRRDRWSPRQNNPSASRPMPHCELMTTGAHGRTRNAAR